MGESGREGGGSADEGQKKPSLLLAFIPALVDSGIASVEAGLYPAGDHALEQLRVRPKAGRGPSGTNAGAFPPP